MTSLTLDGAQAGEGGRPPSRPLLGVTAPGVPPRCGLDRQAVLEIWGGEEGGDTGVSRAPSPPPKPNCPPPPKAPHPVPWGMPMWSAGRRGRRKGGLRRLGAGGGRGGPRSIRLSSRSSTSSSRRATAASRCRSASAWHRCARDARATASSRLRSSWGEARDRGGGGDGTRTQTNREQHWDRVRLPLQGLGGALGGPKESESGPGGVAGCPGGVPGDQRGSRGGPRCSRGAPEDLSVSRGAPRGS